MKNKKSLGQNWLKNRQILDKIAELTIINPTGGAAWGTPQKNLPANFFGGKAATGPVVHNNTPVELCLEIGPGLGTLTSSLLKYHKKVLAIEYDKDLAQNLPKSFPGKNLEVINEDILKFNLETIKEPYVIAGNIPYYITTPIIEKILKTPNRPQKVVLLVQKEVAERIADQKQTQLSLFVQNRATVELGSVVKREEFAPPPKVDSQVIILTPKTPEIPDEVFKIIKVGFLAPRKKLIANLAQLKSKEDLKDIFNKLKIDQNARPSDLGLKDWQRLFENMV